MTPTTPIKIADHLTEQFEWTNKKHLAENFMKYETTPEKVLVDALNIIALQNHKVVLEHPVNWREVADTFVGIARNALAEYGAQI